MTRYFLLGLLAVAFVVSGGGCVNVRHCGYEEAVHPCPPNEVPTPVRQQVYLFMMNGSDVLELGGMQTLRDRLCQAGFSKVYYAQTEDVKWYAYELRRLHRDEPGARILMLSYGTGAAKIRQLAADALRDQLPIDSVIFLDPVGIAGNLPECLPTHTVVVRSHNWRGGQAVSGTENWSATGVGHVALPTHESTVQGVLGYMTAAAGRVHLDNPDNLPRLPLRDDKVPTPRPVEPAMQNAAIDEWDFLKVLPANHWPGR